MVRGMLPSCRFRVCELLWIQVSCFCGFFYDDLEPPGSYSPSSPLFNYLWNSSMSLMLELAFQNLIPLTGLLDPALIQREELSPTSTWYALLCWYPWEACLFLKGNRRRVDGRRQRRGRGNRVEGRKEGKLQPGCKRNEKASLIIMKKKIDKKFN